MGCRRRWHFTILAVQIGRCYPALGRQVEVLAHSTRADPTHQSKNHCGEHDTGGEK